MDSTRREILKLAGAASAAMALPVVPAVAAPVAQYTAFSVGTPGEFNWRVFFAADAEAAERMWIDEEGLDDDPDEVPELDVRPVPHLGSAEFECYHNPSTSDKIKMGWDDNCERCHQDVSLYFEGYHDIGGDCVCTECLTAAECDNLDHDDFIHRTLNEWYDLSDPAIFALLRPADLLDESVREALSEEADLYPDCLHLKPFRKASQ